REQDRHGWLPAVEASGVRSASSLSRSGAIRPAARASVGSSRVAGPPRLGGCGRRGSRTKPSGGASPGPKPSEGRRRERSLGLGVGLVGAVERGLGRSDQLLPVDLSLRERARNRAVLCAENADQQVTGVKSPVAVLRGGEQGALERELARLSDTQPLRR